MDDVRHEQPFGDSGERDAAGQQTDHRMDLTFSQILCFHFVFVESWKETLHESMERTGGERHE